MIVQKSACQCSHSAPAPSTNGITVFSDRRRPGARLSGYAPQAGSPSSRPWGPLATLDSHVETRGLDLVRRSLAANAGTGFGTNASANVTGNHPSVDGIVRGIQTRASQVAASQGGRFTTGQRAQLADLGRRVRYARQLNSQSQNLGDYLPYTFVLPTPVDTGTNLADVQANNFPLTNTDSLTPPATPATAPAPAAAGPDWLTLLQAGGAVAGIYFLYEHFAKKHRG